MVENFLNGKFSTFCSHQLFKKMQLNFLLLFFVFSSVEICCAQDKNVNTLSIDSVFVTLNLNDPEIAKNCTHQAAAIVDSLSSHLEYSFVRNFVGKNYSKTDYRLRGVIFETDRLEDKIVIGKKFYYIKIDLIENAGDQVLSTKSILLKNYSMLFDRFALDAALRWTLPDILDALP